MAPPFTFLDRIDQLVGGPAAVATTVRQLVLPGGDRPVTRAGSAGRIPAADVRRHVVEVALGVVQERVRDGLVEALRDHFAAVREEFEMLEGERPDQIEDDPAPHWVWHEGLREALRMSFIGGGAEGFLLQLQDGIPGIECMADVALAAPVADPDAVLARVGLDAAALDAIVVEIIGARSIERHPVINAALHRAELAERDVTEYWSVEWLGAYLARFDAPEEIVREGVTYVLTDPEMLDTGAELLGLGGDAAFRAWAEERAMLSTPEEDREAVAEVLRLATNREGGDASDNGVLRDSDSTTPETAAGAGEGAAPAAQCTPEVQALLDSGEAVYVEPANDAHELRQRVGDHKIIVVPVPDTPRDVRGSTGAFAAARKVITTQGVVLKDVATWRGREVPVAAEPSDLTRAVSAALSALFDHGCESDKAMAAALGVERSVVAGARKGTAPWAPELTQVHELDKILVRHLDPLVDARVALHAGSDKTSQLWREKC